MDKDFNTFSNRISSKVNVIERLEFKLADYNVAVKQFSLYASEITPTCKFVLRLLTNLGILFFCLSSIFFS